MGRRRGVLGRVGRAIAGEDPGELFERLPDPGDRTHCWSSDAPPEPGDLARYAERRGLAWNRDAKLRPFDCLHAWAKGANLNSTRGPLPGGAYVLLGHQKREHDVREAFHDGGGPASGGIAARIREGHTLVATLVPESRRTLVAATAYAAQLGCDAYGVTLDPVDVDHGWRRDLHPLGDRALFDAVWEGPAAARLRAAYPWGEPDRRGRRSPGGKLDVRGGIASVWAPGYIEDTEQLDDLVELALAFAADVREACRGHAPTSAFTEPLPASTGWTAAGKAYDTLGRSLEKAKTKRVRRGLAPRDDLVEPGVREDERWAGLRDFAAGYARKRDLTLEDGDAFGRAYPALPYTGWAQFAARGGLPGGRPYRVALTAQRPFLWQPHFAAGGVVAVAPVEPGVPDEPLRPDAATGCFHAVTGGLRTVTTYDDVADLGHRHLDLVTTELRRALG